MLVAYLTRLKSDAKRFVKECGNALDTLKDDIGIDMHMKAVGSGDRQKLTAALQFASSR